MRSKEDELLDRLQKCVGRIDAKPPSTQRSSYRDYREISGLGDQTSKMGTQRKYNMDASAQRFQPTGTEIRRNRFTDQENKYVPSYELKSVRNSVSKTNLTERKSLVNENKRDDPILRYKEKEYTAESNRKGSSYLDVERPKRPLREYDLNADSKLNVSAQMESKKQSRSYLNKEDSRFQNLKTPKFDQRASEGLERNQTPTYKRASALSFQDSTDKMALKSNIQSKIEGEYKSKRSTYEAYDYKDYYKDRSEVEKTDTYTHKPTLNTYENQEARELSSQSKFRQSGVGSISSVTRRTSMDSSIKVGQEKDGRYQKILEQVGNTNEDTFSKLMKISELNERINMRIKNIIETFEAK